MPRLTLAVVILVAAVGGWLWMRRPAPVMTPSVTAKGTPARATSTSSGAVPGAQPTAATPTTKTVPGTVVVQAKWGSQAGQLGRRHDPESSPEAPMAISIGSDGSIWVLDQVNRRAQRFKDGKVAGTISLGSDAAQDLIFGSEGRALVLDRLADKAVSVYGPDGSLLNSVSLVGAGVPEGGGVTGVFADDDGVYVEREHGVVVRIADGSGQAVGDRSELIGRPSRDGKLLLQAALVDRASGQIVVRAFDRSTQAPAWSVTLSLGAPVMHIVALDSDKQGAVYVAASAGAESAAPPYRVTDEQLVIIRIENGQERGRISLPMAPSADETFRPVTVGDDGTVYVMVPTDDGVVVRALRF